MPVEQLSLTLTEPIIPVVDISHVTPEEMPRLSRQMRVILDRLKRGDAVSNWDLAKIAIRYSARIHQLREVGYVIKTDKRAGSLVLYTLVSEPGGTD
jgi:hypothetical protein